MTTTVPLNCSTAAVGIELKTPYTADPANGLYRVSGTNCQFEFSTPGVTHDPATIEVTAVQLSFRYSAGGQQTDETLPLPGTFKGGKIRWASAHFLDSVNDLTATWFGWSAITGWRASAQTNGAPPVNFAFFDSCETGQSMTPAALLELPGVSSIDRAAVASDVIVIANASSVACGDFYDRVESGYTIESAFTKYVST